MRLEMIVTFTIVLAAQACSSEKHAGNMDGGSDGSTVDSGGAGADAATPNSVGYDKIFDNAFLHNVELTMSEADYQTLAAQPRTRVPVTVSYDGEVVAAGVRLKGQSTFRPLSDKPGFSIKFNEFDPESRLFGLKKILLNNSLSAGPAKSRVHYGRILSHEVYRRAGLPAPLTAVAQVSLNGHPYGIYVVTEAKNKEFLARNFGGNGNDDGNWYEGSRGTDFVVAPEHQNIELKDEVEEGRSRDDIVAMAQVIRETPDADWAAAVRQVFDLDNFIRSFAVDALTNHGDGYVFCGTAGGCNYYLYHHPDTDRFSFVTHGMDRAFLRLPDLLAACEENYPYPCPKTALAMKVRAIPETNQLYQEALRDIMENAWDVPALSAIIAQTQTNIHSTTFSDPITLDDLSGLDDAAARTDQFLQDRKLQVLGP